MGIPALWKLLGPGEVVSMTKLATDHYKETGRALKVAIDEPGWRFKNLTESQVAAIRQKEPAANPIEKAIFWRICRLMRAHIHPVFVFDGPGRPWKRGRKGGNRVDYERTRLLVQLLDRMRVPHHRAPGEAEAECARMQQLGVVDAVWSDDADSLMFGAGLLIKDYRDSNGKTAKHEDLVQVYRMSDIAVKHRLDAPAIVAYVTLVGGDYDMKGLLNCGEDTVNQMARQGLLPKLGRVLCTSHSEWDLALFRQELMVALAEVRKRIPIPADFPTWLAVKNYKSPKVSTPEQMLAFQFDNILSRAIDHDKLRELLRDRFNIWTKGYLRYVGPILLLRQLAGTVTGQEQMNLPLDMRLLRTGKRAAATADEVSNKIKITFDPLALVPSDFLSPPPGEDWTELATKDGPFSPAHPVEVETLRCLVERGKGHAAFAAETAALQSMKLPASKKRKSDAYEDGAVEPASDAPKVKQSRRASKPLNPQSEAKVDRDRQRRLKRRETYNATRSAVKTPAACLISAGRNAQTEQHTSARPQPSVSSIDLTGGHDMPRQQPPRDLQPPLRRHDAILPAHNDADALEHAQDLPPVDSVHARSAWDEDERFEADTLVAIQQSLIGARMLPNTEAPPTRAALEDVSVNVRVETLAAKSLLLSPRTAVRQSWVKKAAHDQKPENVPLFIDLTLD